ncbi:MAG TPA: hypothetical protein PLS43_05920, partial [Syntrophales bacterium]|nr:hypothetical protein [Syntrophales bacterium]
RHHPVERRPAGFGAPAIIYKLHFLIDFHRTSPYTPCTVKVISAIYQQFDPSQPIRPFYNKLPEDNGI